MQDAFPIRAGGPGWFSYRPGYSSAGQGRLMRMESTAIFFAAGFPASRLRLSTGRSLLLLAAGSLTKITLRFDLGIFVVDAPRRLDAGRCNSACHPLPVTRYPGGRNTGSAGTFTPAADSCLHPAGSLVGSGFDPDLANRAGQSPSHPLLATPKILLKVRYSPYNDFAFSHAYCSCDPRKSGSHSR